MKIFYRLGTQKSITLTLLYLNLKYFYATGPFSVKMYYIYPVARNKEIAEFGL